MSGSAGLDPTERALSDRPDDIAPDGSSVRLLASLPEASMAHFELGPGQISMPVRHRSVSEIWYVLSGRGRIWRRSSDGAETVIDVHTGVSLSIPVSTTFQFRCDGREPLTVVGVTIPPWPGPDEAVGSDGCWEPVL